MCTDQVEKTPSWMTPIIEYLKDGFLPEDSKESWKVRRRATKFWLSPESKLYGRSYSGPYLQWVNTVDIESLLWEIHEGYCWGHIEGRSLACRAMSQGYGWPYMKKDTLQFVQRCERCQRFGKDIHQASE